MALGSEHHAVVTDASLALEGPLAESRTPVEVEAQESERERLARLVTEHFDFVWRLVRRLGVAREDSDDAAQQVFMAAVRRANAIEPGRERAFLYGTTLRIAANVRRGAQRRRERPDSELDAVAAIGPAPDRQAELSEARDVLDEILTTLPDRLRGLLVLVEIEGLEVAEAASLEGIPAGTAASRLRRARELFRAELHKLGARHPFATEERGEP